MEKLSVKKPFTVLVAVIMVLVLGVVSVSRMTTDLLPDIGMPYLIVVTAYPGASPEKVESDVVRPLESALGTVSGVENVFSTAAENYGMVQLEFADGTDMDSTLVKVSSALQEVSLPDMCSKPSIIELSMDMMATMYVSVSREGYDIYELSQFVDTTVQPFIERQDGVASVSNMGLVEQTIQVELDPEKIDGLNEKLLAAIDEKMAEAQAELEKAEQEVTKGKEELQSAQSSFGQTMAGTLFEQLEDTVTDTGAEIKESVDRLLLQITALRSEITDGETGKALDAIIESLKEISTLLDSDELKVENLLQISGNLQVIAENLISILEKIDTDPEAVAPGESVGQVRGLLDEITETLTELSDLLGNLPQLLSGLESAFAGMTQAQLEAAVGFATASTQLAAAEAQLAEAKAQFENAKKQAMESANLNQLLSVQTLSQLIYAQNFSMPAGYIDDKDDNSWLLTVGDELKSADEIANALLTSQDTIGQVRICDVATVTVIDNAAESYTRVNGEPAVILSIFKSSTVGTNQASDNCLAAFEELEQEHEGTKVLTLMNQGSYIDIVIGSVLTSMIIGAILAIVILALFLKDVKPTVVVAISIPLSVMFTLVLMYFTGITLNMMTLAGITLGIGMLVDNSVVVMENIYRLRSRGISAARAAVQGTKQVAGAIIASTLTTVCVFVPILFTQGLVRELLLPVGLCIGYCLMASLIVALTVVPAAASTMLKNSKAKPHPWFDKFLNVYGKALSWCLDHKAVPLGITIGLLALCIWAVFNMGIVLIPQMTGDQIQVSITTPEGLSREESYEMADDVVNTLLTVDGVLEVGVMDGAGATSLMGGMTMGSDTWGSYTCFIIIEDGTAASEVERITGDINAAFTDSSCTVEASAGGLGDMTALLGSGLTVNIYGSDMAGMKELSEQIADLVATVPGYTDIKTSFTEGDATVHLKIDRDKAMEKGLTVAQIYMAISEKMTTAATSTTVTQNGITMDVTVKDESDALTLENLLELELECTTMDETGTAVTELHKLSEFATLEETVSVDTIGRENQNRYVSVTADVAEGYNATLLSRDLSGILDDFTKEHVPDGITVRLEGESDTVNGMVQQMLLLILLGLLFIYLVMVAQFQSLLSPFIVLFTIPLAFTGGLIALLIYGEEISMLSLLGFAILMGTIVNNGIVFVDYANQLRIGGMDRRSALIATGKTRMRPILMTALTTILAMLQMVFSDDMAGQLGGGMSVVMIGGLLYGTVMTLIIVPVMYDILFKRQPLNVDIGSENLDDIPDDAAEFIAQAKALEQAEESEP